MMSVFGLTGGPLAILLQPTLDGKPLKGVTDIRLEASIGGSTKVTITFLAQVDVRVNADVTCTAQRWRCIRKWWRR